MRAGRQRASGSYECPLVEAEVSNLDDLIRASEMTTIFKDSRGFFLFLAHTQTTLLPREILHLPFLARYFFILTVFYANPGLFLYFPNFLRFRRSRGKEGTLWTP